MNPKPGVNPRLVQVGLLVIGGILVAISQIEHLTWQSVVGVVGGALIGVLKVGPNQIKLSDLPLELQESVRPPAQE